MRDAPRVALVAAGSILFGLTAGAVAAAPAGIAVLRAIAPGLWEVREAGDDTPSAPLCVRDPALLFRIRHAGARCTSLVLDDALRQATVDYSCAGVGQGRTTIRVEGVGVAHVSTQGIADGAPFDTSYRLRRIGNCAR